MSQTTNTTSGVNPGNAGIASILRSTPALLAVLCLTAAPANAEEMYLVRDGKKIEGNMVPVTWLAKAKTQDPNRWKDWVVRGGETVDGIFVLDKRPQHICQFEPTKSAVGDCEFTMVFRTKHGDYGDRGGGRGPFILLKDRARIGGWAKGSQFIVWDERMSLALKPFKGPATVNINDGKLHTMSVKRVGDVLTFTVDGQKINEQKIDPDVNLILQTHPQESRPDFAMIKMTAEKFSDELETQFKSAAPIMTLFKGTEVPLETVSAGGATKVEGKKYTPGNATVYRIPAIAVTTKGTLLAFAEARASGYDWGYIRVVVKRSEDGGKTWSQEVDLYGDKHFDNGLNNTCPVIDRETGRIYHFSSWRRYASHAREVHNRRVMVQHSDDDGKTWTEPKSIREQIKGYTGVAPGPHGFQMTQGKYKGRLVVPGCGAGSSNFIFYSDDHGKTWKVGGLGPAGTGNEITGVELLGGDIFCTVRSTNKQRWSFALTDGGAGAVKQDSARYIPELPDPSCHASLLRYSWPKDGKPGIMLHASPGTARGRSYGMMRGSYDGGKSWPYEQVVYEGGYGYSDITKMPDGRVACLFELNKRDLLFTIVPGPPAEPPADVLP